MHVNLIVVPYDSGQRAFRMGRGPEHLLQHGLAPQLEHAGHDVIVTEMTSQAGNASDSAFELANSIADAVRAAERNHQLPVILAGNCISSLGGYAGLGSRTALLWLDAHADFNTPETSPSGFLDGMSLAIITGRCMQDRTALLSGFAPLADSDLVLLGTRDIDPGEAPIVSGVPVVNNPRELAATLGAVAKGELYLHVDVDVIDPAVLRANQFATPAGLTREVLLDCVTTAATAKRIAAIAITAYDPAADVEGRGPAVVAEVIVAALARR